MKRPAWLIGPDEAPQLPALAHRYGHPVWVVGYVLSNEPGARNEYRVRPDGNMYIDYQWDANGLWKHDCQCGKHWRVHTAGHFTNHTRAQQYARYLNQPESAT
mgnify:CR=1 FL=1